MSDDPEFWFYDGEAGRALGDCAGMYTSSSDLVMAPSCNTIELTIQKKRRKLIDNKGNRRNNYTYELQLLLWIDPFMNNIIGLFIE